MHNGAMTQFQSGIMVNYILIRCLFGLSMIPHKKPVRVHTAVCYRTKKPSEQFKGLHKMAAGLGLTLFAQ